MMSRRVLFPACYCLYSVFWRDFYCSFQQAALLSLRWPQRLEHFLFSAPHDGEDCSCKISRAVGTVCNTSRAVVVLGVLFFSSSGDYNMGLYARGGVGTGTIAHQTSKDRAGS